MLFKLKGRVIIENKFDMLEKTFFYDNRNKKLIIFLKSIL